MLQRRVVRMERKRNESLEPASFVLQRAQLEEMIDAVFISFDMAVQHSRIRFEPDVMGRTRGFQPLVAINLVIADDVADAISKDLCATARERVHACLL